MKKQIEYEGTTVYLEKPMMFRLRMQAARQKVTMSEIVRKALARCLKEK